METRMKPILFSGSMVRAILEGRKCQTRRIMKPQPEGELAPLEEWSRGIASACHDHSPDEDRLKTHTDRLRGKLFPFREEGRLVGYRTPYPPGTRLWVKETHYRFGYWQKNGKTKTGKQKYRFVSVGNEIRYFDNPPTDSVRKQGERGLGWYKRPSIFMPRWASRITLDVTAVRAERLQEITEEDAIKEGLKGITKDGKLIKYGIPDKDGLPGTDDLGWQWQDWCANPVDALSRLWDSINGKRHPWASNPWVWVYDFSVAEGRKG